MRRILTFLAIYSGASVVVAATWLLCSYPNYPKAVSDWCLLLALALPAQFAFEYVGQRLCNNKASRSIEARTAGKSFSWLRIAYALLQIGIILGILFGLFLWIKSL